MIKCNYKKVLDLYSRPGRTDPKASGKQKQFFIAHLGGWRSERVKLSDKINVIFNDNKRPDGDVRNEFCIDIQSWSYSKDTDGNYVFFESNDSIGKSISETTFGISEYIVECNYYLIQHFFQYY